VFDLAAAQAQRGSQVRDRPLLHPNKKTKVCLLEKGRGGADEVCVFRGVCACSISQPHLPSAAVKSEIGRCFTLTKKRRCDCLRRGGGGADEVCVFRGVCACSISQPHLPSAAVKSEISRCFTLTKKRRCDCVKHTRGVLIQLGL